MTRDSETLTVSHNEKSTAKVLLLEPDLELRKEIRTTLRTCGFLNISELDDNKGIETWFLERDCKFLLFSDKNTSMPPSKFIPRLVEVNDGIVPIVMTDEAKVDDVFNLLELGVRGYLLRPITKDSLDRAFGMAANASPYSKSLLTSEDRYTSLISLLANNIDSVANAMRDAQTYKSVEQEVQELMVTFRYSAEMAVILAKDGEDNYIKSLEDVFEERAKRPQTRLGRLRKSLARKRTRDTI